MGIFLGDKPVSVYFNGASASLPVQGVFLGGIQVFPTGTAAAILYFDGAVDGAWTTVGNWWLDAGHTQAAGRLPAEIDSVVASATITASGQTVVDFTLNDPSEGDFFSLSGTLTVTGVATFNGEAVIVNSGTVTGNATFNDFSSNGGTVTGNATFNNNSSNGGTVTGNATFNDSSISDGTVTGDATFNNDSFNQGSVSGTATFTGNACNNGGTAGTFVPATPPECD
jgi:hypothetical protein